MCVLDLKNDFLGEKRQKKSRKPFEKNIVDTRYWRFDTRYCWRLWKRLKTRLARFPTFEILSPVPDTGLSKSGWEGCRLIMIECVHRLHRGSSSILKVIFLGHPICTLSSFCREYHVRGFRIQNADIGDKPPRYVCATVFAFRSLISNNFHLFFFQKSFSG